MSETFREQLSRVEQMAADDNCETWDLSDNDQAALKAVLADRQRMATKLNANLPAAGVSRSSETGKPIELVIGEYQRRLAECYRLTGADPDGNEDWRLADAAVEEVRRLRAEHDTAEARVSALEQERDRLREAVRADALRLTTCTREKTVGNVYNYAYWACGSCRYHPGGSDGPPMAKCLNCGRSHYTDDAREASLLIRVVPWDAGLHFEIVEDLAALRARLTEARAALSGAQPDGDRK